MARASKVAANEVASEVAMPRIVTGVPKAGFERDYGDFQVTDPMTVQKALADIDLALLALADRVEELEKRLIPVLRREPMAEGVDREGEMAQPASMDAPVIGEARRLLRFVEALEGVIVDLTGRVQL